LNSSSIEFNVNTMSKNITKKARAVGINHVALEVGNLAEALAFYDQFLEFELESQSETAAFIYFW
jgi:catechol-2,3-dioxygenase